MIRNFFEALLMLSVAAGLFGLFAMTFAMAFADMSAHVFVR